MALTQVSTLQNDAVKKIRKQLIELAEIHTRFLQLAKRESLGAGNSKTMRFSKYPELNLPTSTITEGVDPTAKALSHSYVDATIEQWGDIVGMTDMAELTISHPIMVIAKERLARQAGKVFDREIQEVLNAGTNVYYANAKATRDVVATTDKLDAADLIAVVAKMRNSGAPTYDGSNYVAVIDPANEAELLSENALPGFAVAQAYAGSLTPLMVGEVGKWMGIRFVRSNFVPYLQNATAITATPVTSGGSIPDDTYKVGLVARSVANDQESVIYKLSADATISGGGGAGSITLTTPSDTNYTYDVYVGDTTTGIYYLSSERNAAATAITITSVPSSGSVHPVVPADNVKIHTTYVFGKDAFAVVDLQNLSFHMTPKGSAVGNVLALARYVGWKAAFKAVILENDYFYRIESHSAMI